MMGKYIVLHVRALLITLLIFVLIMLIVSGLIHYPAITASIVIFLTAYFAVYQAIK